MRKIIDWLGGRKWILAVASFSVGAILAFCGKLTLEFVGLITAIGGWYSWGNAKSKEHK